MSEHSEREQTMVLQEPLPLRQYPFDSYAERLGMDPETLIQEIKELRESGVIGRVVGIVKHDRAEFVRNAIVAFEVDMGRCDQAGERLAALSYVSHYYKRSTYQD
ncbi:MAG: hypothetical protein GF344_15315 [Chitinivibrionales bacterium]|nr:hypothetical protein [Chitinivibrionales bacterium]MBD3358075.1 hypothetical protein [Chitinivibrionales bacterium]